MFRGKRLSTRSRQGDRARRNERIAFGYIGALERGDFEAVGTALDQAAHDPDLARMLRDIDAAYLTELDQLSNTQPGHTQENQLMVQSTIAVQDRYYGRRGDHPARKARLTPIWMAAAALVLTFSAFFIMWGARFNGSSPDGNDGNGGAPIGASAQEQTATPFPTLVPPITATPVPFVPAVPPTADSFGIPLPESGVFGGLCLSSPAVLEVRSRPSSEGSVLTALQAETEFRIQTYALDDTGALWLNIFIAVESASIQGWITTNEVFLVSVCPDMVDARALELMARAAVSESEMLLMPTLVDASVIDPIILTATAIIAEATARSVMPNEAQLQATATAVMRMVTATPIGG